MSLECENIITYCRKVIPGSTAVMYWYSTWYDMQILYQVCSLRYTISGE